MDDNQTPTEPATETPEITNSNIGRVESAPIIEEMKRSYLDYAMSVIVSRALPDVRDGLKPVHRRIIYAMHQQGIHHSSRYQKSAAVVGEVMKHYHPHGDIPIYDSMVRMAQNFSMRYMLVDGQGNFGSIDGDSAAAMRYCTIGHTLTVTNRGLLPISSISDSSHPEQKINLKVLSVNKQINKASKWFDSGKHPTLKVTTASGFTVQGTHNHPLLIWSPNGWDGMPQFKWKLLEQVVPGDIAVIDRTADILWPKKNLALEAYIPQDPHYRTQIKILPKALTRDLAEILGALLAEGTIYTKKIEFCNSDKVWIDRFVKSWQRTFPDCRLHIFQKNPSSYGKKVYWRVEIHSLFVVEFLKNLGLVPVKSPMRTIPHTIFRTPKAIVSAFLSAYFEGDGSISSASKMVELSAISTSEELIHQLQIILLRFGIVGTKRFDSYKGTHKLYLRGLKNYRLFASEINFLSDHKRFKLEKVLLKIQKDNSILDSVPFLSEYIRRQLDHRLSYSQRKFAIKHNFDRYVTMQANYAQVTQTVISTLKPEIQKLFEQLVNNNYLFDQVAEVADGGVEQVYSVKVDSFCHSFVANGFINHNTEARLSAISEELLRDIHKDTVDFGDNYSGTTKEPLVLPSVIPNLLLNGAAGIAVGMATQIPPHNLGELIDALIYMIEHPTIPAKGETEEKRFSSEANVEELMQFIKGPDFPTGAMIYDQAEILNAYATGKGRVVMRAKAEIEEAKGGRFDIIITELPYQVNKANLVARIAELHKEKKVEGITDLRDESDRRGMRVVIELKRDSKPQSVLNNLYKYTAMQSVFNMNMVALVDGVPHLLTLKHILEEFVNHRMVIVTRRSEYELAQARAREHILEGLKIAVDNIDEVIDTIRKSKDADEAKSKLMSRFKLSELQAVAILDMQLRRLAALERQKIEDELKQIRELIAYLEDLLAHPAKVLDVIKDEMTRVREKYADDRRTRVFKGKIGEFSEEDLVADEATIVTITEAGYIKRQAPSTFRMQARGGKGVSGMTTKEEDTVSHIFYTKTHDNILFFTDRGRAFQLKVWEIPEATRISKGQAVVNLINIDSGEKTTAILTIRPKKGAIKYLYMCTWQGNVKKTAIEEYASIRRNGLISIKLDQGDTLGWVCPTTGENDLIIISYNGQSIRFKEGDIRATHRDTSGVRGIKLSKDDAVVSSHLIKDPNAEQVLVVMKNGLGKKTPISSWSRQLRGGMGVKAAQVTSKTGPIVTAQIVDKSTDTLVMTSNKGQLIKINLKDVPTLQRQTQGVILMRMREGEGIVAATAVSASDTELSDKEIEDIAAQDPENKPKKVKLKRLK